jgi:hypothetical protein
MRINNLILFSITLLQVNIYLIFKFTFSSTQFFFSFFFKASDGEYWRLLAPGIYKIWAVSEDHRKSNEEVVEITVEPYQQALRQDLVIPSKAPVKETKRGDLDLDVSYKKIF